MAHYNKTSNFPTSVDNLLCLSDIDLEHLSESNHHNELAMGHHYTEAGEYLENTATMDCICASLFDLIENRILTTQTYLKEFPSQWEQTYGVFSPFVFSSSEPAAANREKTPIWTEM